MDPSSADKEDLRERLRRRRRALPRGVRDSASRAVCRRLERRKSLEEGTWAGYLSFDCEVRVERHLRAHTESGETVGLPRVEDDEVIRYVPTADLGDVEEGAFGILEPTGEPAPIEEFDLFLVPGVGFDRSGARLGMGWGYYDRALSRRRDRPGETDGWFIGVCYDCQLVDGRLPTAPHDVAMDAIVTQHEWIVC